MKDGVQGRPQERDGERSQAGGVAGAPRRKHSLGAGGQQPDGTEAE